MNLVDFDAVAAQGALLDIANDSPEITLKEARRLTTPRHHDVRPANVDLKRLGAVLATAYERKYREFAELLLHENLGPRTLQSLALIAELLHGVPSRFADPARFSFALGGKDRHPFPVPLKTYDESIAVLRRALDAAKLGSSEKMEGFARLDGFVRMIEKRTEPHANFSATLSHEFAISSSLDGRSVFDARPEPGKRPLRRPGKQSPKRQLDLFAE